MVAASGFSVFRSAVEAGGVVKAIRPLGGGLSRSKIDKELGGVVKVYGAKGLAWVKFEGGVLGGPIAKFFEANGAEALVEALDSKMGTKPSLSLTSVLSLGMRSVPCASILDELKGSSTKTLTSSVTTDFPALEFDEDEGRYVAMHHPFTSPLESDIGLMDTDPAAVRSNAYDVVLNGYEIGGGSIRIHKRDVQEKMFKLLGLSEAESREKFGFLLDALSYGTPPHGGIALGMDRPGDVARWHR